jgi:hypothetical protein
VTVRVPSQSAADIQGKDAQGNVTGTVTALDLPQRRAKVQTAAGQTLVLEAIRKYVLAKKVDL